MPLTEITYLKNFISLKRNCLVTVVTAIVFHFTDFFLLIDSLTVT